MSTRKQILVTVDTDLTNKQIESNGATLYLLEPGGECHIALEVQVIAEGITVPAGWKLVKVAPAKRRSK